MEMDDIKHQEQQPWLPPQSPPPATNGVPAPTAQHRSSTPREPGAVGRVVQEFSQATTFHGIKYVVQNSSSLKRRLLWLVAWLTSVILLSILVKQKLELLYSYPSSVEIWHEHVPELAFPAVTVCNKNAYRLSEVHKRGWYDAIRLMAGDQSADYAGYYYNESVCTIPSQVPHFSHIVVSTSLAVCQRLCSDPAFYNQFCSGFFWHRVNATCVLTSYTGDGEQEHCPSSSFGSNMYNSSSSSSNNSIVMYFRKIPQVRNRPLYCTFDDDIDTGACPLTSDTTLREVFKPMVAHDVDHDVTLGFPSRRGRVLGLTATSATHGLLAKVTTPLLHTTGKCMMLFTRSFDVVLQVSAVAEDLNETLLVETVTQSKYWSRHFVTLPAGRHFIAISSLGQGNFLAAYVDDLSVRPCEDFYERRCLLSGSGAEYIGTGDKDADDEAKANMKHCACAAGWFACYSPAVCVPERMFCDKKDDCEDTSDEDEEFCDKSVAWRATMLNDTKRKATNDTSLLGRPDEDAHLIEDVEDSLFKKATASGNLRDERVWLSLLGDEHMNMSDFMRSVQTNMSNTVEMCRWNNDNVHECQFIEYFTDMGLCYRFNANTSNTIMSDKVGERDSGLFLILNTESYEVLSLGGEASLKVVLFDPTRDEEIAWDQGIHVSPGFYTTISVSAERFELLQPPYGNCGSVSLNHTTFNTMNISSEAEDDNYSFSRCIRDRQTEDFVQQCGCKNYFMPGTVHECSVYEYFAHCLPSISNRDEYANLDSESNDTVSCPTHCNVTMYDSKVMMTAMSLANFQSSVDGALLKKLEQHAAAVSEVRSRTDTKQMTSFLRSFSQISFLASRTVLFVEETFLKTARSNNFNLMHSIENSRLGSWYLDHVDYVNRIHTEVKNSRATSHQSSHALYIHWLVKCNQRLASVRHFLELPPDSSSSSKELHTVFTHTLKSTIHCMAMVQSLGEKLKNVLESSVNDTSRVCNPFHKRITSCFNSVTSSIELSEALHDELKHVLERSSLVFNNESSTSTNFYTTINSELKPLNNLTAAFAKYFEAVHSCAAEHDRLVDQLLQATDVTSMDEKLKFDQNDAFSGVLIGDTLAVLRQTLRTVDQALADFVNNSATRQAASDRLMSVARDLSACVENVKYLVDSRMNDVWPAVLERQRDTVVNFALKVLQTVRSLNIHCKAKWVPVQSTDEFTGLIPSTSYRYPYFGAQINLIFPDPNQRGSMILPRLASVVLGTSEAPPLRRQPGPMDKVASNLTDEEITRLHVAHEALNTILNKTATLHDQWLNELRSLEYLLSDIQEQIARYNTSLQMSDKFIRENVAVVKIYLSDMRIKHTQQNVAYDWFSFFSDLGGSLGLLLGGSVLSLVEVIDAFLHNLC